MIKTVFADRAFLKIGNEKIELDSSEIKIDSKSTATFHYGSLFEPVECYFDEVISHKQYKRVYRYLKKKFRPDKRQLRKIRRLEKMGK